MRVPAAAIILAASIAASGCIDLVGSDFAPYVEREVKRFTTNGTPELVLQTFDGSIEVRAWDKPEVEVVIERHATSKETAASIQVDAQQTGNRIVVEAKKPATSGFGIHLGTRSAKLIVSAPANANLTATSGDGSITVEKISGKLELRSGDGSIHGRDLAGHVRAHTGDGSIRIEGVKGALDVETADGSVAARGAFTTVHARSGDGSVRIEAESSTPEDDWDITTGDGSVVLELPAGFNGELDARTGDGRVHLQDVTLSNVVGEIRKGSARGRIGSGGKMVRLSTGDGSITVTSRRGPA